MRIIYMDNGVYMGFVWEYLFAPVGRGDLYEDYLYGLV